jgi:DNA-binding CsgD family transcriptional regulator/tetratricopeptide (TPR) repeat protein
LSSGVVASTRSRSVFVGRGAELERLDAALARAVDGKPTALLIGGEAGVGKTRLLREFAGRALTRNVRIVAGSCVDLGAGDLPYAPLVDALRGLVRDLGVERLRDLSGPGFSSLARLAPFLGEAEALHAPDPHARSRMFEAVLYLLDRLGERTPVLLIIEDLQWADRSTLDFIVFLFRSLTQERVVVAASYRSTDLQPGHPLRSVFVQIDRAQQAERFELRMFDRTEVRELLSAIVGGPPRRSQVQRVFELSDGNAFFVEELVAAGALDDTSSYPTAALEVPTPLREMMIARIELMSDEALEVLRAAATVGRHVSHRLLATVCDLPERTLLGALRECVVHHLLAVSPGEDAYAFRHALAREAVYQDLLPGERIRLHGAIAEAITDNPSLAYSRLRSVATEVAHHWWEAGNQTQALRACVVAGLDAAEVCAFAESEHQFARALRLWSQVDNADERAGISRPELLRRAADAACWAGHVDRAIEWAREALDTVDTARPAERAAAYERLGHYLTEAGQSEAILSAITEADLLLATEKPSALLAGVRAARAGAHLQAGRYSLGLQLGSEAVEIARTVGAVAEEGRALSMTGVALTMTGNPDDGIRALRAAVEIADATGDLEAQLRGYANLTFVLENAGRLNEALQSAERGLQQIRRLGRQSEANLPLLTVSAILLFELGRWDEAEEIATEVLERDTPGRIALYFDLLLAESDIYRGRFDAADARLDGIRQTVQRLNEPQSTGAWHACVAELAIWRRQHEHARTAIMDGLQVVREAEDVPQVLRLCAVGLRAEADEAQRLAALGTAAPAVSTTGAELLGRAEQAVEATVGQPVLPEVLVLARQCRAEWSRLDSGSDAQLWDQVRNGWLRLERPHPAAYAALRQAEALLDSPERYVRLATPVLREAHRTAAGLGAKPLLDEVEALATRAQVDLDEPAEVDKRPVAAANPFGLTPRERQVLEHLVQGHTNRRIARDLFITEKTASVHVSNILTKLQVSNRGEAAAVAHRLDLFRNDDKVS